MSKNEETQEHKIISNLRKVVESMEDGKPKMYVEMQLKDFDEAANDSQRARVLSNLRDGILKRAAQFKDIRPLIDALVFQVPHNSIFYRLFLLLDYLKYIDSSEKNQLNNMIVRCLSYNSNTKTQRLIFAEIERFAIDIGIPTKTSDLEKEIRMNKVKPLLIPTTNTLKLMVPSDFYDTFSSLKIDESNKLYSSDIIKSQIEKLEKSAYKYLHMDQSNS